MLYKWAKKFKTGNFRKYKLACKRRLWQTSGWTWWLHNQLNQTYLANYDIALHKRNPPVPIVPLKLFNGIYIPYRQSPQLQVSWRTILNNNLSWSRQLSWSARTQKLGVYIATYWVALQEILWSSSTGIFEAALPLSHNMAKKNFMRAYIIFYGTYTRFFYEG